MKIVNLEVVDKEDFVEDKTNLKKVLSNHFNLSTKNKNLKVEIKSVILNTQNSDDFDSTTNSEYLCIIHYTGKLSSIVIKKTLNERGYKIWD